MAEAETEDGNCPTCGLKMDKLYTLQEAEQEAEFQAILAILRKQ